MDLEQRIAQHYAQSNLDVAIATALRASGKNPEQVGTADLHPVDEFHLGWHDATVQLARDLGLGPGQRVLDIGSGIGGPARHFAAAHGCQVTGIDLTQEFVDVATALTRRAGLGDRVTFRRASGLALPFGSGSFEAATLIHVGMNVADKGQLFAEVRRVLVPGGRFCVHDVMRTGSGDLAYPTPWAESAATSFVEAPEAYRRLLEAHGFAIEREHDWAAFTLTRWREARRQVAAQGLPPLGLHVLMGASASVRLGNVMTDLEQGALSPIELIARRV